MVAGLGATRSGSDGVSADIIIAVHNQSRHLMDCLHSLWQCTCEPYHVIVVDDGSKDGTTALLRQFAVGGMRLTVIRNDDNRGFTKAANQGLRASCGEYAVLLGGDTKVTRGWLPGLIATAASDDRIGIVGPGKLNTGAQRLLQVGGAAPYHDDTAAPPTSGPPTDEPRGPFGLDCQYVDKACMLVKGRVMEAIGYLDEVSGDPRQEDINYCLRARRAGFRVVYSPWSDVYKNRLVTALPASAGELAPRAGDGP